MRPKAPRRSLVILMVAAFSLNAAPLDESRLDELSRAAMQDLRRQDYNSAIRHLTEGAAEASNSGRLKRAALFKNALCGAQFAAMEYGASLRSCADAIATAKAAGDRETMGVAELNRSVFLLSLGDRNAAQVGLGHAQELLGETSPYRIAAMAALGTILGRQGQWSEARALLRSAVGIAGGLPDRNMEAYAWGTLGELELRAKNFAAAERALLAAFRIRRLHKLAQLEGTWWQLGQLELARGRAEEALRCFEHGILARRSSRAHFAAFLSWQGKALALEALGRKYEARAAYRRGLAESAAWRNEIVPVQGFEIAADVRLAQLASGFARLSGSGERESWEAFQQIESTRAAGLRRQILVNNALAGRLGKQHLDLLRDARNLKRKSIEDGAALVKELREVEARLTQIEAETLRMPGGATWAGVDGAQIDRLADNLRAEGALITFWVGEPESRVWVITRKGRAFATLPGAAELGRLVERQRNAINGGSGQDEGRQLYRVLFGGIPEYLLKGHHWQIVADGPLWSLPWAALVAGGPQGGRYLIEYKTLEFLPSATWLGRSVPLPQGRLMLAAGDAVHNRADARLRAAGVSSRWAPLSFWLWPEVEALRANPVLELPTLAGSAKELETACMAWGKNDCLMIRGRDLTTERLSKELERGPAVVHVATHLVGDAGAVMETAGGAGESFLALSLSANLVRDGFWASGVSRMRAQGALIVLSACSSARGAVLPGAGLQGFGRAWLAAGARGVVGTLWPVTDSGGAFFDRFYRDLAHGASPALALRSSQLQAIAEGGWRARPQVWAGYMLLGKD